MFLLILMTEAFIAVLLLISLRHHSYSVHGHVQEHDGAVERPQRCQLL